MRIWKIIFAAAFISAAIFSSCKKEVKPADEPTPEDTVGNAAAQRNKLLKDSTLFYSREIYLWYNQIPASFDPQPYTDPNAIMEAIRQYSKEPGFDKPVDRWSFAMLKKDWDNVSSGIAGDFGLGIFFNSGTDLRVKLVEKASPAGLAGIRRGWRIVKINGNANISTSDADVDYIIKNVFQSTSTDFTFEKPDGSLVDIKLTAKEYQENPIILDTVYNISNKKVGYLAFNSFLGNRPTIKSEFQRIFQRFQTAGIGDAIIDLRYNGGGYVDIQSELANYLVPTAGNEQIMMKQSFNDKYADEFDNQDTFHKKGSLNLPRIFFIVSNSTASASELLINNLKPFMDVKLVGPDATYGKPVGYFPIGVFEWYVFPVSFRTVNNSGEGSYFDGLQLTKKVRDGLDKDWGDTQERCLASVLSYITTGNFTTSATKEALNFNPQVIKQNKMIDQRAFKGAIAEPVKIH